MIGGNNFTRIASVESLFGARESMKFLNFGEFLVEFMSWVLVEFVGRVFIEFIEFGRRVDGFEPRIVSPKKKLLFSFLFSNHN